MEKKRKRDYQEEAERHEYIVEYETNYNERAEAADLLVAEKHARLSGVAS